MPWQRRASWRATDEFAVGKRSRTFSTSPAAARTRASRRRNARRAAPSSSSPAARPAAAPSTAPRSRCNRSPTSPISCMARSPAKAIPGTIAARKSSGSQLYRTGFTTDINETDIVFGGEKRLFKAIKEIIDKYDPPAVFVYQTCVPAMIGDDIDAVCKAAREKFGKPVIPINSPGFVGPKNLGNKLAGEALLDARDRHRGAGIHHALRHQHHRRIQSRRRAVAGEAAARRARHPHPLLHLRRRADTTKSPGRIAPRRR